LQHPALEPLSLGSCKALSFFHAVLTMKLLTNPKSWQQWIKEEQGRFADAQTFIAACHPQHLEKTPVPLTLINPST